MLLLHSKRIDGKKTMLYGMSDISAIHGPRFFFLNHQVVLLFSETKINVFLLFNHATIQIIYVPILVIT